MFSESSQAVGLYCSCHAAMLPKLARGTITKPSEQVAAPHSMCSTVSLKKACPRPEADRTRYHATYKDKTF